LRTLHPPTPTSTVSPRARRDTAFFGHPRGLSTLFFAELWERFSYYGMRAILILFMTAGVTQGGLGFPIHKAGLIYGTYTSMVYLMSVPGGWVADAFLGLRRAILFGGIVIMAGHICLAIPSVATFYLGLILVVLGTGLLKPSISAIVGDLYAPDDARREAGFSIYYMGINLGAFLAPLVVGWLAQSEQFRNRLAGVGLEPGNSWHFGFAAAAVGMFAGLVWYVAGWKHLGDAGVHPAKPASPEAARRQRRILQFGLGGALGLIAVVAVLDSTGTMALTPEKVGRFLGYVLALTPIVLFPSLYLFGGFNRQERRHLIVIMTLFFGAAVFWSVFEQAGSTLNLFAERNTDTCISTSLAACLGLMMVLPAILALRWMRRLEHTNTLALGFAALVTVSTAAGIYYLMRHRGEAFPSSFFQSANALFIVILVPFFAALWTAWGDRQPSSPAKFTVGILFAALGFGILIPAAFLSASGAKVSPMWLTATYLLHTIGELCLSPVGLSAMTRLAPQRIVGLVLGIWFLAASLGNFMAGFAASLYERLPLATLFTAVTGVALVATVVMAASVGPIRRMLASD
jgi:POT family proton-dependent oligopeptide transporter